MRRIPVFLFFLVSCSISYAQTENAGKNNNSKRKGTSTEQDMVIYVSYDVQEDSTTANIKYINRPSDPAPTSEMIEEAIRIVSEMKIIPERDASGQLINTQKVTRIKFSPK